MTLGATHHIFPEYYLFGTEACSGWNPLDRGVKLGSWQRAESYAHDIIGVSSSRLLRRAHVNPVERMCDFKVDHPPPLNPPPPPPRCSAGLQAAARCQHSSWGNLPVAQRNKLKLVFFSVSFSLRSGFSCVDGAQTSGAQGGICLCRCVKLPNPQLHTPIYTK